MFLHLFIFEKIEIVFWVTFMGMGLLFSIGSTVSFTKIQRNIHESTRIISKLEDVKVEIILAEHNHIN